MLMSVYVYVYLSENFTFKFYAVAEKTGKNFTGLFLCRTL